ncbi:hypothetical protein KBZ18_11115 [Synechococcus sp. Cruz-9H2]|uniref:hypothetical protein n=1 Tax=unclassified Synechococcus TaxID=2626047 RepID=UPI0020CD2F2A|nr:MULTISPECIES: hypothetical protein [unclassified Synechococcus]MCP9820039.1 hypothetical protein [Synechococcus sp. Cruz-9H2]MCP9844345.1 hypothetical protein [Synechococcus sp. Edmonson 11F2]MCP9856469.1 hypothetical protein [Synechococcus sp. Cruz-9C9]MCP9863756.1 hypothetical protein [Synechococcus sp. Cruz-7E5]MCP9870949.1 hypothetical protein [Synechococcus sp. Cruz-7B9]
MQQQFLAPRMKLPPRRRQLEQEAVVPQEVADLPIGVGAHSHEGWSQCLGGIDGAGLDQGEGGVLEAIMRVDQGCKSAETASREAKCISCNKWRPPLVAGAFALTGGRATG